MSLFDHIDDTLQPFPGALCIANVLIKNLDQEASDKPRPVVLSRQRPDGGWLAWGLTNLDRYRDGTHRVPATGMDQCGMPVGYVFGGHAVQLPPEDIYGVVWAAPRVLLEVCCEQEKGMPRGRGKLVAYQLHEQHVADHWVWPKP